MPTAERELYVENQKAMMHDKNNAGYLNAKGHDAKGEFQEWRSKDKGKAKGYGQGMTNPSLKTHGK